MLNGSVLNGEVLNGPGEIDLTAKATGTEAASAAGAAAVYGDSPNATALATGSAAMSPDVVLVSWDPPTEYSDGTPLPLENIAGYKIHYGTQPGIYSQVIDAGNVTNYLVSGLAPNIPYYFVIGCYDLDGFEGAYSDEITRTRNIVEATAGVGGSSANVSALGTQATGGRGDAAPSGAANVAGSGQQAAGSGGSASAGVAANAAASGQEAAGAAGDIIAQAEAIVAAMGKEVQSGAGDATTGTIDATGMEAQGYAGTAVAAGEVNALIRGLVLRDAAGRVLLLKDAQGRILTIRAV
jgi:hypothetical protein